MSTPRTPILATLFAAGALVAGVVGFAGDVHAGKRARAGKAKAAQKVVKSAPKAPAPEIVAEDKKPVGEAATPAADPNAPQKATAPGKPRVYTFGGLDVTGNLKAPQMLFFRGRVQQELDTSSPEKRSFLKELERTADAKGL